MAEDYRPNPETILEQQQNLLRAASLPYNHFAERIKPGDGVKANRTFTDKTIADAEYANSKLDKRFEHETPTNKPNIDVRNVELAKDVAQIGANLVRIRQARQSEFDLAA